MAMAGPIMYAFAMMANTLMMPMMANALIVHREPIQPTVTQHVLIVKLEGINQAIHSQAA